jgi:hypothetical protein
MDDFPGMFTSVSSGRDGSTIESYILARSGGGFFHPLQARRTSAT